MSSFPVLTIEFAYILVPVTDLGAMLSLLQVPATDDTRYRHHSVHDGYERQGCKTPAELDGCAVSW